MVATGITLPTVYVNICLDEADWVYKWFDPHGGEDLRTLDGHVAALVLHPLLRPAGHLDTGS